MLILKPPPAVETNLPIQSLVTITSNLLHSSPPCHHRIIEHLNFFDNCNQIQINIKDKLILKFLSAESSMRQSNIIATRPRESSILMNWMAVLLQLVVALVSLVQLVPSVHL